MAIDLEKEGSPIGDLAADWAARLEQDQRPQTLQEFELWMAADPRHRAAFDAIAAMLDDVSALRQAPAFAKRRLKSGALRASARKRFALAASIGLGLVLATALYALMKSLVNPLAPTSPIEAVMLSTGVGEVRQFALADGSQVTLDTASALRVDIAKGRRRAALERGRARFVVAPSKIPLEVQIAKASILVSGGTLDVSALGGRSEVDVLAGSARVAGDKAPSREQPPVSAPAAIEQVGTALQQVRALVPQPVDWVSGHLSFTDASLGDVANAANRYTHAQILIPDSAVGRLRVTGVFRTGDAEGLAKSLARLFGLRSTKGREGNFVLDRPKP